MKVYISGKITGTTDYMERFERAEKKLKGEGYEVVNPAKENSRLPEGTPWETYMRESIKMLCECDAIYMLWEWRDSKGACLETGIANNLKMELMYEERPIDEVEMLAGALNAINGMIDEGYRYFVTRDSKGKADTVSYASIRDYLEKKMVEAGKRGKDEG